MTLPGLDREDAARADKTIGDHAAAIRDVIADQGDQPAILVAHSGANATVSLVLDRYPELVARVIWVDSGPVANRPALDSHSPARHENLPLPSFDALGQQASLEGLGDEALERFRVKAVPQPAAVIRRSVELTNEARHRVPTTLVCCSIPGEQAMDMARAGHPVFAEVSKLECVDVIDLPTGHWPMWSRPRDLAKIIRDSSQTT